MKVYGHPRSTCTRKVLTVLAEKGAPYDFQLVELGKQAQKSPEHLARQPFGVVPVLEDEWGQMYESRAIMRYLDRQLKGPELTPREPRAFAWMEQFLSVEQSYFSGGALEILKFTWKRPGYGPEQVEAARPLIERAVEVADRHLQDKAYFAGDALSLADISWAPYVDYLAETDFRELVLGRPAFAAWWQRVSGRPSWQRVSGRAA